MNKTHAEELHDRITCFNCGSTDLERRRQLQTFQYGSGESAVELNADVPLFSCNKCGFEFAGPEAEEARQEAVYRHLGLLAPHEIVEIRTRAGMSRVEFADCTRIGIASIKRWESGAVLQNAANDELIYLMSFPENVERLQHRDRSRPLEQSVFSEGKDMEARHRSTRKFRGRSLFPDNYAMALWGLEKIIPDVYLQRIAKFAKVDSRDPNNLQCFSLVHRLIGNEEMAAHLLDRAREMIVDRGAASFSCWSYLNVSVERFAIDLEEMAIAYKADQVTPKFIKRNSPGPSKRIVSGA